MEQLPSGIYDIGEMQGTGTELDGCKVYWPAIAKDVVGCEHTDGIISHDCTVICRGCGATGFVRDRDGRPIEDGCTEN